MATGLKKPKNTRGSGVSGTGTASDTPADKFYVLPEKEGDLLHIPLTDITANPFNDRDLGDFTKLADSIKRDGLVQEIAVMHTEVFARLYPEESAGFTTKYVLAFGERRWRAHQLAGLPTIASVLRDTVAPKIRRILFIENFHRKPLSPLEEARKFHQMSTQEGMSYQDIVDELHLSGRNHVSRRLDLMKLPAGLQEAIESEQLAITHARKLLQTLPTEQEQVAAWHVMRDREWGVKEAISLIQSGGGVPPGNTDSDVPNPRVGEDSTDPETDGPGPEESSDAPEETVPDGQQDSDPRDPEPGANTGTGAGSTPPAKKPQKKEPAKKVSAPAADRDTPDRLRGSADRTAACEFIFAEDKQLTGEQFAALCARSLLVPVQASAARARAHGWLRDVGKAEFSITDTDSYFQAVLSSGSVELINRLTLATAIAGGEIRARDGRRQWDATDAQHVQLLIEVANYHPQTQWERGQLTKFHIEFPGGDEPADPTY